MVQLRDGNITESVEGGELKHNTKNSQSSDDDKENHAPGDKQDAGPRGVKRRLSKSPSVKKETEDRPATPEKPLVVRDNRPTPGRMVPPRRSAPNAYRPETDPPEMRSPSPEPPKKKRMNAFEKDRDFTRKCLKDPNKYFHDLHICFRKGRDGSPTYDAAGFQLDYDKVAEWMKPQRPRKSKILKDINKVLERGALERRKMSSIFFKGGKAPEGTVNSPEHFWQDKVSKDMGIPFHKIDSKSFEEWERQGFEKQDPEDWKDFTEAESRRMLRLTDGQKLRK